MAYGSTVGGGALQKAWNTGVSTIEAGKRRGAADLGTLSPLFEEDATRLLTKYL